jgi:molecular chaperone GrpE
MTQEKERVNEDMPDLDERKNRNEQDPETLNRQDDLQENADEMNASGAAQPEDGSEGGQQQDAPEENAADAGAAGEEAAEAESSPEDPSEADPEEDVLEGNFRKADEKKGFFRRKKDKRDEKIEELSDQVRRQMAEFDNFRKRTEKEKSAMFETGARSVIEKILPVVDNFERGLAAAGDNSDDPFAQGMEKIYRQLIQTLEQIGVTPIEAVGKEFDPNFHNAVMHCEDDSVGDNIIVQELQKGYMYRDSVVRHSMVKVAN